MGTLYLIATPIGNLEDISARALRLLGEVNLIAAEDTRHTRKLLTHFGIKNQLVSYFEHSKLSHEAQILAQLESGNVALVSDAGTPGINDPGYALVQAALEAGYTISPVPGACAPIAALICSGMPSDAFSYLGYLPRKQNERRRFLQFAAMLPHTLIFLESPHRLVAGMQDMAELLGNRRIAVAREMTKLHEEILRGTLSEMIAHFQAHEPRGEFTLVVAAPGVHSPDVSRPAIPAQASLAKWDQETLAQQMIERLRQGQPLSKAAADLSAQSGWPRRQIYQQMLEQKQNLDQ